MRTPLAALHALVRVLGAVGCCAFPLPPATAREPGAAAPVAVTLRAEALPPDGRFRFLPDWRAPSAPRTAFALGGGAGWGAAHVGLLQAAAEDGVAPDLVAGTSIGALVGSLYAAGLSPAEIERAYRGADWTRLLGRPGRPFAAALPHDPLAPESALYARGRARGGAPLSWRGLVADHEVQAELLRLLARPGALAEGDLDALAVPFRAVSVDLASGTLYAPDRGPLALLVRASLGLPVFRTVEVDGRVLVDGGVLENVPAGVAREMGGEAVVAVRLSSSGSELGPPEPLTSLGALLERTYDVAFAAQRRSSLAAADVVVDVATGSAPLDDFTRVEELLAAGRSAWAAQREDVFAALERRARDTRRFTLTAVRAAEGTAPAPAHEIAARLGLARGAREVSVLRLELELVRALRAGAHPDGSLTVGEDGVAELALAPAPPVRALRVEASPALAEVLGTILRDTFPAEARAPAILAAVESRLVDLRRRGLLFAGIERVAWDPAEATLTIEAGEGRLAALEVRSRHTGETIAVPARALRDDAPARLDDLLSAVFGLYARGALSDVVSVDTARVEDGRYTVRLLVAEPPVWEMAATLGYADPGGIVGRARMTWPTQPGFGRWGLEARLAAGREGLTLGLETSPPGAGGRLLFGRVVGGRSLVPRWTTEGGDFTGTSGYWSGAAALGARTRPGRFGFVEGALALRAADEDADLPPLELEAGTDVTLEAAWRGDTRDDDDAPTRGVAWSLGLIESVAGVERGRVLAGEAAAHLPLGRWSVALLGVASATHGPTPPLDRWTEPGGLWEAPRLFPGRGLSPDARRGTLLVRRELGTYSGVSISAAASGAAWRLGAVRADPDLPRDGHCGSLFVAAQAGRFGTLLVGVTTSSIEGDGLFVAIGPYRFPRSGPVATLPR